MVITLDTTRLTTEEKAMLDRIVDNCNGYMYRSTLDAYANETAKSEVCPNNSDYVIDRVADYIGEYLLNDEGWLNFLRKTVDEAIDDYETEITV